MKYSLVTFTINRGPVEKIRCFLNSWFNSFKDIEIIVVDSSSDVDIKKYVEVETCKIQNARYIYLEQDIAKWSKTDAHNLGIVSATGDFIITTDVDIYCPPYIENLIYPIIMKDQNKLYYSRTKFVKEIKYEYYFNNDINAINKNLVSNDVNHRRNAMGGLQISSSSWFKSHLYNRKVRWGGMDNGHVAVYNGINLTSINSKIWMFHMYHPEYKLKKGV